MLPCRYREHVFGNKREEEILIVGGHDRILISKYTPSENKIEKMPIETKHKQRILNYLNQNKIENVYLSNFEKPNCDLNALDLAFKERGYRHLQSISEDQRALSGDNFKLQMHD
jgi:hypothetical protein